MSPLQGLRICRSCLSRTARVSVAEPVRLMRTRALGPRVLARGRSDVYHLQRRTISSTAPRQQTSDTVRYDEDDGEEIDEIPEFERQRLATFEEDRLSQDPVFPESYPRLGEKPNPMAIPTLRKVFSDPKHIGPENPDVTVYGRVRGKRAHGNRLLFLDIVNEYESLQTMINFKKCVIGMPTLTNEKFRMFMRLVEVGDHMSVTGNMMLSSTGELTLEARGLPELLSPAMEQLPTKLTHNRMRRRHVDLLVNQEAADILRLKSHITKYMRDFFHARRYLEYQTPILAERAGGALARPFTTTSTMISSRELQMRIAPELWLKRLVVGGVDKVFEIGPVFRNEGIDADHNPEFTMCEFYSAYMNLEGLINETEVLMCSLAGHCNELISTQLTALKPPKISISRPFKQIEFIPGLEKALGFLMPKLSGANVFPELLAMLRMAGISVPGEVPTTLAKLLDRLSAIYLEPKSFEEPIFITKYPACMSPLAKSFVCRKTFQLVSARTELFINGREMANMYEEENSPYQQANKLRAHREMVVDSKGAVIFDKNSPSLPSADRMTPAQEEDAKWVAKQQAVEEAVAESEAAEEARRHGGAATGPDEEVEPLDKSYVRAMRTGLPPTGGWGCGIERLVMLFSGANRISDCFSFGSLKNVISMSADERMGIEVKSASEEAESDDKEVEEAKAKEENEAKAKEAKEVKSKGKGKGKGKGRAKDSKGSDSSESKDIESKDIESKDTKSKDIESKDTKSKDIEGKSANESG